MKTFAVELRLLSPALLAASPPAANLTETLRHVPGNSLRGLLARRYLDAGGAPQDDLFRRLFVLGEARFGDALPEGGEVLPLSARSCKYDPGFPGEGGHGVVDLLLGGPGSPPGSPACPACPAPLDYFHGVWAPDRHARIEIATRFHTRTAIDPRRGTARTARLYTQEVLAEGQRFVAEISLPGEQSGELEQLLAEPFEGTVGTGGSRGQGWVEVRRCDPVARDLGPTRHRFDRFAERVGQSVLAVTLRSDAVLRDDYLRFRSAPEPADLEPLGVRAEDWSREPSVAFLDVRNVFGFDGAPIHLPRQPRRAITAGSTFLFEARDPDTPPHVPDGPGTGWIGEDRREGFGRAVLWHPFHVESHTEPHTEARTETQTEPNGASG